MRRLLRTAPLGAAAALLLAACGTTEPAADEAPKASAQPITLTDASGAKVELDGPARKVVGTEWNVVEHLLSLGVEPVGVADVKGYKTWDSAVPLTGDAKDIGTRGEPSTDTIAALNPDLIVATTDLQPNAVEQLRKIAPVLEVKSADASDPVGQMLENLDLIAKATGTAERAATLKKDFDAKLAKGAKALEDAGLKGARIAFSDGYVVSNQVSLRPYTSGSLVGGVNERLGLKNAWKLEGDEAYGLAATDVEGLTALGNVHFAYIGNEQDAASDPFGNELKNNAVWKSLPFVKSGDVHRLDDGIWMFGGTGSMERYVDALVAALTK
ncbi:ABC transporter substrate-binding protein [Streptomyces albogriseolus]|uniref:ABC transporter substrate-binding protein n=1 Tax=Streptomyces albogriseolus TaxID=1887 RepID=UPI003D7367EE